MTTAHYRIDDPPFARALFGDPAWAWMWLLLRCYVGGTWLREGVAKAQSPAWVGSEAGTFLNTWLTAALAKTAGSHPDVQGWYAAFLRDVVVPNTVLWSYLVTFGEIAVGLGLLLGAFTGIAAFFGTVLSASFLLAGTVSINPLMFGGASLLVLAWKTAGWWGADRWILPAIGTPWAHAIEPIPDPRTQHLKGASR
jgi:thiosulfate dehydrogenase [quinone] large subunit